MRLRFRSLMFFLLGMMFLTDLFVVFNFDFFYLRRILGFVFLSFAPGFLIYLSFRTRVFGWKAIVYSVGLSVFFVMFAGLAVNWFYPLLGVNDPLTRAPVLMSFNVLIFGLWLFAFDRNRGEEFFEIKFPSFDYLNKILLMWAALFPFLAVVGAFLLNSGGGNWVSLFLILDIALYVFVLFLLRKSIDENLYIFASYFISVAVLLMFSMRSWYFRGGDVIEEFKFFSAALKKGFWDLKGYPGGYNVCLSITILPVVFSIFMNSSLMLFKFFIPAIFSFISVALFLFFRKFVSREGAFFSVFFFVSQIGFMVDMPSAIRQEIAFLGMALFLLAFFDDDLGNAGRSLLMIFFGFAVIVSHYSTGYVFLVSLLAAPLAFFMFAFVFGVKDFSKFRKISVFVVLAIWIFGIFWYVQATPAASSLERFLKKSFLNFNYFFSSEYQSPGQSFLDQFRLVPERRNIDRGIYSEVRNIRQTTNPNKLYANASIKPIRILHNEDIPPRVSKEFSKYFFIALGVFKRLGYFFVFIGMVLFLFYYKRFKNPDFFLIAVISFVFFSFVVLLLILPFGSLEYGVLRMYQQGLIVFSFFVVVGIRRFFSRGFLAVFLIVYFLSFSGFFNQVVGGSVAFSNLNNFGFGYAGYISVPEKAAAEWLSKERNSDFAVYSGSNEKGLLKTFAGVPYVREKIFPIILLKDSYVFFGDVEKYENSTFCHVYGGIVVKYLLDKGFIESHKDRIYSNQESDIFM